MAWMEDTLVLLPQYPRRLEKDGSAFLVTVQKEAILAYLNLDNKAPIETGLLEFDDGGLSETLEGFEGFEAIAFAGEQVFMTIETSGGSPMMGYLVSGLVDNARQSIRLDPGTIVPLLPQTDFRNASDESLILRMGLSTHFSRTTAQLSTLTPLPMPLTLILTLWRTAIFRVSNSGYRCHRNSARWKFLGDEILLPGRFPSEGKI